MEIKAMNETAARGIQTEQGITERKEATEQTTVGTENEMTENVVIKESKFGEERGRSSQGDQFISSEKELHEASGTYSISSKANGSMEIKFDDVQLEKKRNSLKQEIMQLKASNLPQDQEKLDKLKQKLAESERKIRMQKQ